MGQLKLHNKNSNFYISYYLPKYINDQELSKPRHYQRPDINLLIPDNPDILHLVIFFDVSFVTSTTVGFLQPTFHRTLHTQ